MARATHRGTCQACERLHKLPGGMLAQHGYQVLWGSFEGVCMGSDNAPLEESCGLLSVLIESAQQFLTKLEDKYAALLRYPTEPKGWVHEYVYEGKGFGAKRGYRWNLCEIVISGERGSQYRAYTGKLVDVLCPYTDAGSATDVAFYLNGKRAALVEEQEIKDLRLYIARKQKVVRDWKPGEVKPIISSVSSPA